MEYDTMDDDSNKAAGENNILYNVQVEWLSILQSVCTMHRA